MPYNLIADPLPRSCVSLARYAKLTGYSECAIMGVNNPTDAHGDCENPIWTQYERDTLMYYLAEAQEEIEGVTTYPLCPTYFTDEEHPYAFPIHAKWTKILAVGVRAETVIDAGATVDYTDDPAQVGPIATAVTDVSEIHVFYPDSEREIEPIQIQIAGGNVTIYIPRCRLVAPEFFATPQGGLDYTDDANFLEAVDVKRVYTDNSTNAQLVYAHRSTVGECPACGCATCGEALQAGCLYVRNAATGALDALPASFSDSAWTVNRRGCYCARPDKVRVNYLAGLNPISLQAENAVLRLAHAKMPSALCGCDPLKSMWERDRFIPEFIDEVRYRNPFGPADGALTAYRFATVIRTVRAGVV